MPDDQHDMLVDAPRLPMLRKLRHWDELCRTDPQHTKPFQRAGGFKGTAIRPIWNQYRLTEHFGPCGIGWGFAKPEYQIVQGAGEQLVYCTIMCWYMDYNGQRAEIYGVGGDKVTANQKAGPFNDDEAFKKAMTDAIGNAFLRVGLSADVHMGLFEDSKYVQDSRRHFAEEAAQPAGTKLEQFEQKHAPAGVTGEVAHDDPPPVSDAAWIAAGNAVCEKGLAEFRGWWNSLGKPLITRMGGQKGALFIKWKTRAIAADERGGPAPEEYEASLPESGDPDADVSLARDEPRRGSAIEPQGSPYSAATPPEATDAAPALPGAPAASAAAHDSQEIPPVYGRNGELLWPTWTNGLFVPKLKQQQTADQLAGLIHANALHMEAAEAALGVDWPDAVITAAWQKVGR